jgi:thioredoxin reductase (NADPH)
MTQEVWDTLIVGAGSAGMSAAIYAARFNLKTLMIGTVVGGLLNESHCVENYPGFKSIPGLDLMMNFKEHVDSLNIPLREEWVKEVTKCDDTYPNCYRVATDKNGEKAEYITKTIVFATGATHKHLGVKGEDEYAGKGVSYCATCDAAFYRNVPVAIVGGGDSAALAANLIREFASHVYVIVRKDCMRAEPINRERIEKNEKVTILYETEVEEILGVGY